jgi:hypothetical protein
VKLQVDIPDRLAALPSELASREHITVYHLIASALTAQLDKSLQRPTIDERAHRVDWEKVDEILARVPNAEPLKGDER